MPQPIRPRTFTEPEQLADAIRRACPGGGLVGIEGFMNSGKTRLAFELSELLGGIRVGLDSYVDPGKEAADYTGRLRHDYLAKDLVKLKKAFPFVFVDGICLIRAVDLRENPLALTVYVKRLSPVGIWHDEIHLEKYEAGNDGEHPWLRDCELAYPAEQRPHDKADCFYERTEA